MISGILGVSTPRPAVAPVRFAQVSGETGPQSTEGRAARRERINQDLANALEKAVEIATTAHRYAAQGLRLKVRALINDLFPDAGPPV